MGKSFMFNLELKGYEVLHLGKILIDAATDNDNEEAVIIFHRLGQLIEKGAK
jgi:hypothetical protein